MRSNPSAHIHNDKILILWKIKPSYHVYSNNKEQEYYWQKYRELGGVEEHIVLICDGKNKKF